METKLREQRAHGIYLVLRITCKARQRNSPKYQICVSLWKDRCATGMFFKTFYLIQSQDF